MVKVRIIKVDNIEELSQMQRIILESGAIYEAFEINNEYMEERYKKQYAINIYSGVWWLPADCCEVVEDEIQVEENKTHTRPNILLVEDGSVDVDEIVENFGIKCIVYRQGANKPEWLYKDEK